MKKGTHSAGVAPQYSGTAGKVQNCQIGVFLAYASGKGHALIDRALYLPEPWCADAGRRAEAAIPEQAMFATKPALAQQMIARALDAGVPCAWVLGDEVYGSDHKLQRWLEQREQPFVLTVRSNEKLWATKPAREGVREKKTGWYTAAELTRARPASAWQSHSAGAGTKGERVYDWARLRLARQPGPPRAQWQLLAVDPAQSQGFRRRDLLRGFRPGELQPWHAGPCRRPALDSRGMFRGGQAGGWFGRL